VVVQEQPPVVVQQLTQATITVEQQQAV